jgi:hypothetical protein
MQKWSLSIGWDTEKELVVHVNLENEKVWWYFLDWLHQYTIGVLCNTLRHIKIPKFIRNWKRKWNDEEELFTFEEYYGRDLGCLADIWIYNPTDKLIWNLSQKKKKWPPEINLSFKEANELLVDYPQFMGWIIKWKKESDEYEESEAVIKAKTREVPGSQREENKENDSSNWW